jgi:pimeloyl-ACP methyl ester carboxylesterase
VSGVARSVEVSAGRIAYEDTGGEGPVVVLVHGLAMDGRQWQGVVEQLRSQHRCLLPTLPMGAHREPMRPDADLSLRGMVRILAEFLERLDLRNVTLCFNDWCGGPVMIADGRVDRVARLVFVSCEAFENYPPGLAGHAAWLAAKIPGGVSAMRETLLRPSLRQLPFVFGQMAKHPVPEGLMRDWMAPLRRREIRRDFRKYAGAAMQGRHDLLAATTSLASFEGPVLVAWDSEGRMMPNEHGRRLADAFPDSHLVEIPDAYTLVPLDQPELLSSHIGEFIATT